MAKKSLVIIDKGFNNFKWSPVLMRITIYVFANNLRKDTKSFGRKNIYVGQILFAIFDCVGSLFRKPSIFC